MICYRAKTYLDSIRIVSIWYLYCYTVYEDSQLILRSVSLTSPLLRLMIAKKLIPRVIDIVFAILLFKAPGLALSLVHQEKSTRTVRNILNCTMIIGIASQNDATSAPVFKFMDPMRKRP